MSQAVRVGAERKNSFPQKAAGQSPAFFLSAPGTPSPTHTHSSSFGFGFLQNPGALAPELMPFHKITKENQCFVSPLGKERPISPSENHISQNSDSPKDSLDEERWQEYMRMTKFEEQEAWIQDRWDEFHGLKKRRWALMRHWEETDPQNKHLPTLHNHVSFKCRTGAKNDSPSIGYIEGSIAWLNLHKCGSIWGCPICHGVLMKKHEQEITEGLLVAANLGYDLLFHTQTIPHKRTDDMAELMEQFMLAKKFFKKGGDVTRFLKQNGFVGNIVRLEATFGDNGIHPHNHTVMIFNHKLTEEEYLEISNFLTTKWKTSCIKAGLVNKENESKFNKYGFNIKKTNNIEEVVKYMTKTETQQSANGKQSLPKELTNAADTKREKRSNKSQHDAEEGGVAPWGRSPWDVMRGFLACDHFDTHLWLTFLKIFHRKSAIRWSEGLREKLSIEVDEREDEEKVKLEKEKADLVEPIYEVKKYRNVLKHGLWNQIIKFVKKKDFIALDSLSSEYNIDFESVDDKFPSIYSRETMEEQEKILMQREARLKQQQDEAEAARCIAKQHSIRIAKERALLAARAQYAVSLLPKEDAHALSVTVRENRRAAKEQKRDERLRRKGERKTPTGRRVVQ